MNGHICMGEGAFCGLGVLGRGFLETVALEFSLKAVSTCLPWEIWIQQAIWESVF